MADEISFCSILFWCVFVRFRQYLVRIFENTSYLRKTAPYVPCEGYLLIPKFSRVAENSYISCRVPWLLRCAVRPVGSSRSLKASPCSKTAVSTLFLQSPSETFKISYVLCLVGSSRSPEAFPCSEIASAVPWFFSATKGVDYSHVLRYWIRDYWSLTTC